MAWTGPTETAQKVAGVPPFFFRSQTEAHVCDLSPASEGGDWQLAASLKWSPDEDDLCVQQQRLLQLD